MNKYEIYIEDIYNKGKTKKVEVESINVYLAHKKGLKFANALREEISRIVTNDKTVFTFKNGFSDE